MRTILFLLRKEFTQIFRNKSMLPIIFIMPVVQLVILVNAADFEVKNVRLTVQDADRSTTSQELINRFSSSKYFTLESNAHNFQEGMDALDKGTTDIFLRIPSRFEQNLARHKKAEVMLDMNAIDGQFASVALVYARAILQGYNVSLIQQWHELPGRPQPPLHILSRFWYNLNMSYKNLMVPGLLVVLVTLASMFLSSMNIVREVEIGTIEQLNVTPIKKWQFILGKQLPFWFIAMFLLGFGLFIGKLIFDIPLVGSLWLLFGFAGLYIWVALGVGLFISTITRTQQQAMFVSWFFLVIFILMSGLFTPIENMPHWAQVITWFNPVAYFVEVIRFVLLKGSNFQDIQQHFAVVGSFALGINLLAIINYRKRS